MQEDRGSSGTDSGHGCSGLLTFNVGDGATALQHAIGCKKGRALQLLEPGLGVLAGSTGDERKQRFEETTREPHHLF